ncbi:hypothetical protein [Dongia deserti]|uniref:hypothetical protein n=1 Tax=Dongia deserti TaxID=2268030 RepID=UPI0013C4F9D3|nr:hypothetical protein [Dongia deserti]
MPRTTAIFLGALFVLSTITAGVVGSDVQDVLGENEGPGEWHISASPGPAVWKLNTRSGALYYCTRANSCILVANR